MNPIEAGGFEQLQNHLQYAHFAVVVLRERRRAFRRIFPLEHARIGFAGVRKGFALSVTQLLKTCAKIICYAREPMSPMTFKPLEIADVLKLIGALIVFVISLYQYVRSQKWKRREFIAQQIKEFEADPEIRMMMKIFDWTDRTFFFPSDSGGPPVKVRVNDDLLCSALLPHEHAGRYDLYEVLLRDRIDRFLDMLVRLDNFVEAHLISVDELKPYVSYWIELISGNKKDWHTAQVWVLLLNYIKEYDFPGAANLIKGFGFSSEPDPGLLQEAIARTCRIHENHHVPRQC